MFEPVAAAYVMAVVGMLIAGASALTLIWGINHFDPPEVRHEAERQPERVAV